VCSEGKAIVKKKLHEMKGKWNIFGRSVETFLGFQVVLGVAG
jgi:hypothetical protein